MNPRQAFTILELLAVIAISGVLAAMLLSAVRSARSNAERTVCANNLREIDLALRMYSDDSNDAAPKSPETAEVTLTLTGYKKLIRNYLVFLIFSYLPSIDLKQRPKTRHSEHSGQAEFCPSRYNILSIQPAMTGNFANSVSGFIKKKISQIPEPAQPNPAVRGMASGHAPNRNATDGKL